MTSCANVSRDSLLGADFDAAREVLSANATSELIFDRALITVREGYVVGVRELLPAVTASA